jgi:hypothetical protein
VGFGEKNLRRIVQFAAVFADAPIVATLRVQAAFFQPGLKLCQLEAAIDSAASPSPRGSAGSSTARLR